MRPPAIEISGYATERRTVFQCSERLTLPLVLYAH